MFEWPSDDEREYFDPSEDGFTHLNIYSKARTKLGRDLSNFSYFPFVLEPYGKFDSVEGFWYWYLTGQKHDDLRHLSGAKAKAQGKKYNGDRDEYILTDETIGVMQDAIMAKIMQHPALMESLKNSTLPFCHYYVYFGKVVMVQGSEWFNETFENIRTVLKENNNGNFGTNSNSV